MLIQAILEFLKSDVAVTLFTGVGALGGVSLAELLFRKVLNRKLNKVVDNADMVSKYSVENVNKLKETKVSLDNVSLILKQLSNELHKVSEQGEFLKNVSKTLDNVCVVVNEQIESMHAATEQINTLKKVVCLTAISNPDCVASGAAKSICEILNLSYEDLMTEYNNRPQGE